MTPIRHLMNLSVLATTQMYIRRFYFLTSEGSFSFFIFATFESTPMQNLYPGNINQLVHCSLLALLLVYQVMYALVRPLSADLAGINNLCHRNLPLLILAESGANTPLGMLCLPLSDYVLRTGKLSNSSNTTPRILCILKLRLRREGEREMLIRIVYFVSITAKV
jgi:hypothetical protein